MGIHFERGRALFALKRYQDAIREYQLELAEDARCVASQSNIAAALFNLGQTANAKQALALALQLDTEYAHAHYLLSFLEPNRAGDSAAQRAIEEAIRLDPSASYWCRLGKLVHQQGRYAEAIAAFDRALAVDACHVESLSLKANSLHQLNRTNEALQILESTRSLAPENSAVHRFLGSISLDAGKPGEALQAYLESQRINPLQAEIPEDIAKAYGTRIWPFSTLNRLRSRYLSLHHSGRWVVQASLATLFLLILVTAPRSSEYWSTSAAIGLLLLINGSFVVMASQAYAQALGVIGTRSVNRRSWHAAVASACMPLTALGFLHLLLSIAALAFVATPAIAYFLLAFMLGIGAIVAVHMASGRWAIVSVPLSIFGYVLLAGYGAAYFHDSPGTAATCWMAVLALSGMGSLLLRRIETRQLTDYTPSP